MSWTRTAIALIGFGFTIVQFFERLRQTDGVAPPANAPAARYLGMALIVAGTIGLAIGVWQYMAFIRYLWRAEFTSIAGVSETPATPRILTISMVVIAIGIAAFSAVLLRVP